MQAIIFDSETTGFEDPEVIETAWVPVNVLGNVIPPGGECARWKPSKPIELGALAMHHILDEELIDCPPSSAFRLPDDVEYLIGHNVDFDWRSIGEPLVKRIDTCAMCRTLWPDADSHSQAAMLYLLARQDARNALRRAHSAAADIMNCRIILAHVIGKAGPFDSFEAMWEASERMRVPTKMPMGKHRGMPIKDVPRDYRRWLLGQPDVDPYLRKALSA